MRLALKFMLPFLAALGLVLLLYGYSVSRREIRMFEDDLKRDQSILGHTLALAVRNEWDRNGQAAAMDFVALAAKTEESHGEDIRWIWVEAPQTQPVDSPRLPDEVVATLHRGGQATWVDPRAGRFGRRLTATPVRVGPVTLGAVQVGESLADQYAYTRTTVTNIAIATATAAGAVAVIAILLGARMVGRPVGLLVRRAREVAAGDLERHVGFRQHDELRELADEIDAMCDQLAAARQRIADETAARITALEQLRHADRLKTVGQLASGLAHELGTPLNVVRARAKMIAARPMDDTAAANAQIIVEQSDRITGIIRQILDFARPRPPRRCSADLGQVAEHTLALLRPIADKLGVRLELVPGEVGLAADADPDQLQQVLSNLVLNAIQAMPAGGTAVVTLARQHVHPPSDHGGPECDCVRVDVRDQGGGIAEESLAHLFEPFFTTKPVGAGTGLGLSVSLGIVREHGGWIAVDSRVGEGTCFSVFLPQGAGHGRTNPDRG